MPPTRPPLSAPERGPGGEVSPPPLPPVVTPGPLAPFRSRDYRLLYQGTLLTQGANWMQQVAQQWILYTLTGSPLYLGLAGFARASPMLVLSPFGGVLADRLDRRRVMLVSQVFATVVAVWQWAIVALDVAEPWQILLAAFLTGGAMAVNGPARQSVVPNLVERRLIRSAVALNSAGQNATRVVGPTLAGVLTQAVGASHCFLIQAVCLVWSVVTTAQMKVPETSGGGSRGSALENLGEAFAYIRATPLIAGLIWLAAIPSVFAYSYLSLLPVFAKEVLHGDSATLGILMAANGAGAVFGAVCVAVLGDTPRRGRWVLALAIGYNLLLALFALSNVLPLSLAFMACCGLAGSGFSSLTNTILNEVVPDELRGRVMSAYMLTWGLTPLGALPAGALAEVIGAPWTVAGSNLICAVLLAGVAWRIPQVRRAA